MGACCSAREERLVFKDREERLVLIDREIREDRERDLLPPSIKFNANEFQKFELSLPFA